MPDPRIQIEGSREVRRSLNRLESSLEAKAELKDVLRAATVPTQEAMLRRVKVRTGFLRGTIKAVGGTASAGVKVGLASVPYAPYLNFGTKYIKGDEFATGAVDERGVQEETTRIVEAGVADLIEKYL